MKKKLAIILGVISCVVCITVAVTVGVLVSGDDEPTYYTVTFDTQGGTEIENMTVLPGDFIGEIEQLPTKECSTLIGFATDAAGKSMWDLDTYQVNGDLKLYAIWDESHTWGEWEESIAPGCETEGERTRSCEVCRVTENESVDPL